MQYIPRAENAEVDELAKAAANNLPIPNKAFLSSATSISNVGHSEGIPNGLSH